VQNFGVLATMLEAEPGTRLPSRRRQARRARAEAKGITIPTALMEEIDAL
jgi:LDH2 family malate/lactate/ureidoglycolate dehydrogenase